MGREPFDRFDAARERLAAIEPPADPLDGAAYSAAFEQYEDCINDFEEVRQDYIRCRKRMETILAGRQRGIRLSWWQLVIAVVAGALVVPIAQCLWKLLPPFVHGLFR